MVLKIQRILLFLVYARANSRDKDVLWKHLMQLHNVIDVSWCLVADFNEIVSTNEKLGGPILSFNMFQRLNNFLTTTNAGGLQVSSNIFTWKK